MATHKGLFKVKNRHKYVGNVNNVVYRSGWELKVMMDLDHDPKVARWSSEELIIPYMLQGRRRRYFPDFFVEYVDGTKELWEVKPLKETRPPSAKQKSRRRLIQEATTFEMNKAKWAAASEWCNRRGIKFRVLTEKELFNKRK